jgi:hypothetical protein
MGAAGVGVMSSPVEMLELPPQSEQPPPQPPEPQSPFPQPPEPQLEQPLPQSPLEQPPRPQLSQPPQLDEPHDEQPPWRWNLACR